MHIVTSVGRAPAKHARFKRERFLPQEPIVIGPQSMLICVLRCFSFTLERPRAS